MRVLTLNVFHGGASSGLRGDSSQLETRLTMVIDELRALRPDLVALQEASVGRGRGNVAARLAEALGLYHVHAPATARIFSLGFLNRILVSLMNFSEGPAVLSRFPISGSIVHDLPRCERGLDPRVLLETVVATPSGPVRVYSVHTGRDPCQHQRVADVVLARRGQHPSILMGDFNAGEGSPSIGRMTDAGFVDGFRAANAEAPGLTVWQQIDADHSTVFRRVDYVFVLPGSDGPIRVVGSRVVVNTPRGLPDGRTLWPSDHYGVLVDLAFGER